MLSIQGREGVSNCVMICDGGGRGGFAAMLCKAKIHVRLTCEKQLDYGKSTTLCTL